MRSIFRRIVLHLLALILPLSALARPVEFDLPAQPLGEALLAFSQQARLDVLFSSAQVRPLQSTAVRGRFEPDLALQQLLSGTGLIARRNFRGKIVVALPPPTAGAIGGRLTGADGEGLSEGQVLLPGLRRSVTASSDGTFRITGLPPGDHRLILVAPGHRSSSRYEIAVESGRTTELGALALEPLIEPARLAPFIVEENAEERRPFDRSTAPPAPRTAAGNLDLRRSESDVLPYTIFDRDRITRSGVVDLNQFLQRELLEGDGGAGVETSSNRPALSGLGGGNLAMRGFGADETVILINGRRLPEVLMTGHQDDTRLPADVSYIPLSLVQRVEVLPASASALYSGNAVGGVINIVLRPDVDVNATEVTATYTNALHGYDAPQSNVAFMHGRSFLNGALRLRLNGNFTQSHPPTESELGYRRKRVEPALSAQEPLFRATPNIRSADGSPLFGPGTASVTSVPPGRDGTADRAWFTGREGVRNFDLFDAPGGLASSINSQDYAYGRAYQRASWFLSTVYDATPWLQLGLDGIYSHSKMHRGYDVFAGDLRVEADSPFNPFGQPVQVSLNETAPDLGEAYSAGRVEFASAVAGALIRLPADWRVLVDTQLARNTVEYRGAEVDTGRWQQLVNDGRYNPLRDTQQSGPPPEFYDQVLVYRGRAGDFVTLGDYTAWDTALRITQETLRVPTGEALLNVGGDYRWTRMQDATEQRYHGDGTPAGEPERWRGRTLERISAFGELQAPLLPATWLPRGLAKADLELAARYVTADTSQETNFAPTYGLRLAFRNGLSLRGAITTSNRYPTPQMASLVSSGPGSGGSNRALIVDPRRDETYEVPYREVVNFDLQPEDAVTQTAGVAFQRGAAHRIRVSIDYFDTRKNNEAIALDPQAAINLEEFVGDWVQRAATGNDGQPGRVVGVTTGRVNAAWRHSRNWTASLQYDWDGPFGGVWETYGRWIYFEKFDLQFWPNQPAVDQLTSPDGSIPGLLRHRANFGTAWSNRLLGFGVDGRYFHSRPVPVQERELQGADEIEPHWQFDLYGHINLKRWLPWKDPRYGLKAQLRVNNLLGPDFPYYWATGAQAYGDWRGRTYSLSVTAVF